MRGEVSMRLGRASRGFACLQSAIFHNKQLSMATKREVYNAVVLPTLLYEAETVKADSVKRMRDFYNCCIRSMLGVSRLQQWKEGIASRELAETIGMTESMAEILRRHHLRWLGHVARMEGSRMPKQLLFGELEIPQPRNSTKRRWRDLVAADAQAVGLGVAWYRVAQERKEWEEICRQCRTYDINKDIGHCAANSFPGYHYHPQDGRLQGYKDIRMYVVLTLCNLYWWCFFQ